MTSPKESTKILRQVIRRHCLICNKGFANTREAILVFGNENKQDLRLENVYPAHRKCYIKNTLSQKNNNFGATS